MGNRGINLSWIGTLIQDDIRCVIQSMPYATNVYVVWKKDTKNFIFVYSCDDMDISKNKLVDKNKPVMTYDGATRMTQNTFRTELILKIKKMYFHSFFDIKSQKT